jgi:hypothetical protein
MTSLDPTQAWPNAVDAVVTIAFLAAVVLVPAAGYVFMVLDVRAYLWALRRGLSVIGRGFAYGEVPEWARAETPRAIAALGLRMPCSESDLKRAYRNRVKRLHPDRGGDERLFRLLQANFEEALMLVRAASPAHEPTRPRKRHAA